MKNMIILICSLTLFTVSSCKKELDVRVEKTFVEQGATSSSLGFGGIILTLMPDGKADFLNGGDAVQRGTYAFKGGDVVVTVNDQKLKFQIISDTELRYDKTRVLILGNK